MAAQVLWSIGTILFVLSLVVSALVIACHDFGAPSASRFFTCLSKVFLATAVATYLGAMLAAVFISGA